MNQAKIDQSAMLDAKIEALLAGEEELIPSSACWARSSMHAGRGCRPSAHPLPRGNANRRGGARGALPVRPAGLRALAFAFGVGCGLVFDEFALFWNLNPEYAQSLSLLAAAVMVSVLVQLTYFRRYWGASRGAHTARWAACDDGRREGRRRRERPGRAPPEVEFLADLDDETLRELFAHARPQRYGAGAVMVGELEAGADVYVDHGGGGRGVGRRDRRRAADLGKLGPGAGFGEMSSLTGELRSATVTAPSPTWRCASFRTRSSTGSASEGRRSRWRSSASCRTASARRSGPSRSSSRAAAPSQRAKLTRRRTRSSSPARAKRSEAPSRGSGASSSCRRSATSRSSPSRPSSRRCWPFASPCTCPSATTSPPSDVLRAAYMTGFASLVGSACTSLLTFRPEWRRAIAVFYGIGVALIFNELGVTLAFDIFYKDIHTPDPNVPFDVERLYERGRGPRDRHRPRGARPGRVPAAVLPARRLRAHDPGAEGVRG